mgnify:CR=1 FL=1
MPITYRLDITPVAKPRMTQADKWKKRPSTDKYWQYKDDLRKLCMAYHYKITNQLDVIFYIEMPRSWSKKKREMMRGEPHQQVPDTDNLMKGFKDALADQDCAIWDERGRKYWSEKGAIEIHS